MKENTVMDAPVIEVRDLRKVYERGEQKIEVLKGITLSIGPGEFTSIIGPSGSGKSTLLHLMGGLDRPSSGQVLIHSESIGRYNDDQISIFRRRKLGFIFQFFNLLPTLTALENVLLPVLLDGRSSSALEKRAKDLLDSIGLRDRMYHRPDQLSGGQMQRVAIARALITDPWMVLADEPTGNLDSESGIQILELLARIAKERSQVVVMVTHDLKAASFGNRLIKLRDGLIEADQALVTSDTVPSPLGFAPRARVMESSSLRRKGD